MKLGRKTISVVIISVLLMGCTASPEEVCAHADALAKKEKTDPIKSCKFKMQMKSDTSRDEYNALAPCIMSASDVKGVNGCLAEHQK